MYILYITERAAGGTARVAHSITPTAESRYHIHTYIDR